MPDEIKHYSKEPPKAYTVFNVETMKVLYSGNSLVKAITAIYSGYPTGVSFANPLHELILKHAVALQERMN